eukprot:2794259-Pyramimonas_sp.AAC.1
MGRGDMDRRGRGRDRREGETEKEKGNWRIGQGGTNGGIGLREGRKLDDMGVGDMDKGRDRRDSDRKGRGMDRDRG